MNRPLIMAAIVVGIVFLGLSVLYFITPAASLPSFLPGFEPGVAAVHTKHGIGALIVALALFAFAWFRGGPRRA